MTTDYLGYESEPSEGYLQPDKVRVYFECNLCGHEFSRVYKAVPKDDPPCPRKACKEAREEAEMERRVANRLAMLESGQTPGITGRNPMVNVVDNVAERVMSDYNLTDLKDNIREGESMAPALPGPAQVAADNFFKAGAGATGLSKKQSDFIARRALSGAYRQSAVSPMDVFPGQKGESALWKMPGKTS